MTRHRAAVIEGGESVSDMAQIQERQSHLKTERVIPVHCRALLMTSLYLDHDLVDLAGEGVVALLVVAGNVGLAVEPHVRAFICGERERLGLRNFPLGDVLAIDAEDRPAARARLG